MLNQQLIKNELDKKLHEINSFGNERLMTKQEKSLTMTVLMTPDMANFSGNVHGDLY
jgi:hypothetical protein